MDTLFYIAINGNTEGPFTIEQLKQRGIAKDTFLWTEGFGDWTKAEHIPILADIIVDVSLLPPPPLPSQLIDDSTQTETKEYTPWQLPDRYHGYKLAGKGIRFLAAITSWIIISIVLLGLDYAWNDFYFSSWGIVFSFLFPLNFFFRAILAVGIGAVSYALWGRNLGHFLFGLKVIYSDTGLDFNTAANGATREGLKNILSLFVLPVMWILWDNDNQSVYDKILNVYVVYK